MFNCNLKFMLYLGFFSCSLKSVGVFIIVTVLALFFLMMMFGFPDLLHKLPQRPYCSFPYPPEHFVGRDEDVKKLVDLIDFSNRTYKIICIVGPPGIGKSALAKAVGNEMISNGALAHYIDMAESPNGQLKQVLAEKIFQNLHEGSSTNVTFDNLLAWAGRSFWNNLIVLDNCEEYNIDSQKQEFQDAIEQILSYSTDIKILVTSRESMLFLSKYYTHRLGTLNRVSACELLEQRNPSVLNDTEKNLIAELTGDVPLALRIVGSLFSIEVPPTAAEIIEKLKKNPIFTLSPEKLVPRNMQLNHSIMLSYGYLETRLQKIARYLAHFPGSFNKPAAVNVLSSMISGNNSMDDSVTEMVIRSWLEYNKETRRYYFHKLVKEFLLLHSENSEAELFDRAFQQHFTNKLCEMSKEFYEAFSPKSALAAIDIERHNFQNWMNAIIKYADPTAVNCFAFALTTKYLSSQFRPTELVDSVESVVNILQVELISSRRGAANAIDEKIKHRLFVDFVIELATITQTLKGKDEAFKQLSRRIDIMEDFKNMSSHYTYTTFYKKFFLSYKPNLNETSTRLYSERILMKNIQTITTCTTSKCDYNDIAYEYYTTLEYEIYADFFEKALGFVDPGPDHIYILVKLHDYYSEINNLEKTMYFKERLLAVFTQVVINEPLAVIHSRPHIYLKYYARVKSFEKSDSEMVLERIISAQIDIDEKYKTTATTDVLCHLAKLSYDHREYEQATTLAKYLVDYVLCGLNNSDVSSLEHSLFVHMYIGVQMVLSKSAFHRNSTEANERFVTTIDYLIANNFTVPYKYDFTQCCSYLISLKNYDYTYICYMTSFGGQLTKLLKTAMIIQVLLIPLEAADKLPATNEEFELQIECILHQNALGFLFYLLSVFVRITLTYHSLKFLVRICRYAFIHFLKPSVSCYTVLMCSCSVLSFICMCIFYLIINQWLGFADML